MEKRKPKKSRNGTNVIGQELFLTFGSSFLRKYSFCWFVLGLNLDIRHITFASGNLALAIYGADYMVDNDVILGYFRYRNYWFCELLVSFGLSLDWRFVRAIFRWPSYARLSLQ